MAALRAGRHAAALLLLQALAVPTAAAHTFRYAWVIAAALSVREALVIVSNSRRRSRISDGGGSSVDEHTERLGAKLYSPCMARAG